MTTIRRCDIYRTSVPGGYDGKGEYPYSAQVSTSVDGGKTFWHCGEGKYCRTLEDAEAYRASIESGEPMRISMDNGHSYVTIDEAMQEIDERDEWDYVVSLMDDDIREAVHNEIAPCSNKEFLTRYLEIAPCDLIIG